MGSPHYPPSADPATRFLAATHAAEMRRRLAIALRRRAPLTPAQARAAALWASKGLSRADAEAIVTDPAMHRWRAA